MVDWTIGFLTRDVMIQHCQWYIICPTAMILCMHPVNERWRYNVTESLIGWAHTDDDPWSQHIHPDIQIPWDTIWFFNSCHFFFYRILNQLIWFIQFLTNKIQGLFNHKLILFQALFKQILKHLHVFHSYLLPETYITKMKTAGTCIVDHSTIGP